MELSIIIVSYNTSDLLRKCLNKLYKSLSFSKIEKVSEIIVVDNASSDDSVAMVENHFPKVIIIRSNKNLGFARGNNTGIKKSSGKYILLLNSDTEVENNSLVELLTYIKGDINIGVVGGQLLNPDRSIQPSMGFFPSLSKIFFWMFFIDDLPFLSKLLKSYHIEDKSVYRNNISVDWVTGACFLLRREVIDKVGLFDDNIFMYGEELEWCYRIKKAGFEIAYTSGAHIMHHKGGSVRGETGGIAEEFGAILYLYKKHKPSWQLPIARIFLTSGALLRIILFGIIDRYKARVPLYEKAFKLVR